MNFSSPLRIFRRLIPTRVSDQTKIFYSNSHLSTDTSINCRLVVDLSSIPKESLKLKELDGDPYCQVTFSLLLENLPSGLMRFSIRIDGKEYSAVEAKY